MLTLVQLNAFAAAAEKDLLDDGMVTEFVRQLELNEKWKKSTIDVEDPRLAQATQRARAEKILAMKEARAAAEAAKETANN
jgi:aryl carrier-like protein